MARNEREGSLAAPIEMLPFSVQQPSAAKAGGVMRVEEQRPGSCLRVQWLRVSAGLRVPAGAGSYRDTQTELFVLTLGLALREADTEPPPQGDFFFQTFASIPCRQLYLGLVWLCPPV